MIGELHGKHYYMELVSYQEAVNVLELIANNETLNDKIFNIKKYPNGKWVIYSECPCENKIGKGFRGDLYHEWERVKQIVYRRRRA